MSLDDRLKEILKEHRSFAMHSAGDGVAMHNSDEAIAQIKQAFADNNYVQLPTVRKEIDEGITVNGKIVMTGQEWFDRFEVETAKITTGSKGWTGYLDNYGVDDFLEAAKKASGLS